MISALLTFGSIALLDIVLSGDNAVVVGALAASLQPSQRGKALLFGIGLSVVIRVLLSLCATELVTIPFLRTVGGLTLFYVSYGMYSDLTDNDSVDGSEAPKFASFGKALWAITLADLSMSIDNILAVGGVAAGHYEALVFGLVLSIAIMGLAASQVAKLIDRYKWIAWLGMVLIVFVGCKLIYEDFPNFIHLV